MLSLESLKRDWPGVGRSYFGEIEESPLVSPGSNNLGDPVLLRLLCGAVSPVEATQFWAPVSGFLDQFILNHLSVIPEAPKETLKICSSVGRVLAPNGQSSGFSQSPQPYKPGVVVQTCHLSRQKAKAGRLGVQKHL